MFILIVGAGRVGSAVAKRALDAGHEVSVLDSDPLSHERLDKDQSISWEDAGGRFTVGAALEVDGLVEAGIEHADVFMAATRGDNTNLVIAQLAQRRFNVPRVVVRVADPARAAWYGEQGLLTICPTQHAIDQAERVVLEAYVPVTRRNDEGVSGHMYVIIAGAGKVGWNLARELIAKDREVTLIESDHRRFRVVEEELEHAVQYGDATELWVLERAGIQRADLVIAVTGDDEDNILICQVAKEKYGVDRIVARVNNPRNLVHFKTLDVQPAVSATDLILRLIEHEVPEYGLVQLLALEEEHLEIIELEVGEGSTAAGCRVQEVPLPEGSLIISVLRNGDGLRAQGRLGHPRRGPGAAHPRSRPGGRDHAALRARGLRALGAQVAVLADDGRSRRRLRADRRRPGRGELCPLAAPLRCRWLDPPGGARARPAL